jgi:hypothetical protein
MPKRLLALHCYLEATIAVYPGMSSGAEAEAAASSHCSSPMSLRHQPLPSVCDTDMTPRSSDTPEGTPHSDEGRVTQIPALGECSVQTSN